MTPEQFDTAWAEIEATVPELELDQQKVGEVAGVAWLVHPLRDQISAKLEAGEVFGIRLMVPPDTAQIFLGDPAGDSFISVATTPVTSFAAGALE